MKNDMKSRRIWFVGITLLTLAAVLSVRTWLGFSVPGDYQFVPISFFAKAHTLERPTAATMASSAEENSVPDRRRHIFIWLNNRPAEVPERVSIDGVPIAEFELHEASLSTQKADTNQWLLNFTVEVVGTKPRRVTMLLDGEEKTYRLRHGFEGASSNRLHYEWGGGSDTFAESAWSVMSGVGFPEVLEFALVEPSLAIPSWSNAVYVEAAGDGQSATFMTVPSSHTDRPRAE